MSLPPAPNWLMGLIMLAAARSLYLFTRGGNRPIDKDYGLRVTIRVFCGLYYLALWLHPDVFSEPLQRAAGRNFFAAIMAIDAIWMQMGAIARFVMRWDWAGFCRTFGWMKWWKK